MKNTAIVTICDNSNYGNRLQNYALYKAVSNLGLDSVTLWDYSENILKKQIKLVIKKILGMKNLNHRKNVSFEIFTNKNISNKYVNLDNLKEINNEFDYFIVGSDQIWNYDFGHAKDKDFLKFADYNKTISYAPSFGISNIDEEWKDRICSGINHIKHLSVRENQGAEIIKELTKRESEVVLDPTLLLSKEEWGEIQKKPKKMIKEKYILTYFLGEKSEQLKHEIKKIEEEKNLKVINMNDIEEKNFYACGPSEFLYLFNHAEIVLTDSFHACVFSMIFNKPFYVFDRNTKGMKSMNSRLDTLLSTFEQEDRKVNSLEGIRDVFSCDYKKSYEILKIKQNESLSFLKNALDISNKKK
ncbi:MAG: polysaccharide pyruvyl transferase family protein [Romboutsia sp.]